ncbi:MAG: hypothetical protein IPI46_04255 [Bacteroidetes bacterium]|nr:hypothetical protein [Bacteroidota bacterium]
MKFFATLILILFSAVSFAQRNITSAEYYFGSIDPGEGNANPLLVFDGAFDEALETVFAESVLLNATSGSFILNVRVRDAENHWGPVFKKAIVFTPTTFSVSRNVNVSFAEYFLGSTDPGEGNATTLLVFDGAFDEALETVFADSVLLNATSGSFLLNVRVRDEDNHWGPLFKKAMVFTSTTFGITRNVNVSLAEYFLGSTDPGEGNATTLLVFDGAFDEALETVFADSVLLNATSGSFLLNVRVRDANNHWGPLFKKAMVFTPTTFGITRNVNVSLAEYFIGMTDPGAGNANTLLVFDGAYDEALETLFADSVILNATSGSFLLNVRAKDAYNHWGPLFKKAMVFTPTTFGVSRNIHITAGEYFFGLTDPGEGNGTSILAFDGNYDEAIETLYRSALTWTITSSPTLFNIRVRDIDNHWGPVFKKVIYPNGINPYPSLIKEGDSIWVCEGQAITLHYFGPNGYALQWFNTTSNDSIQFTPLTNGYYTVHAQLGAEVFVDSIYITVQPMLTNFFASDTLNICQLNYELLAASGPYTYLWTGGATTSSLAISNTGLYSCILSLGACQSVDSVFVSLANAHIVQNDTLICEGESLNLDIETFTGMQSVVWSTSANTNSIVVSPSQTTSYTCEVSNGFHTCTDTIEVIVSSPNVQIQTSTSPTLCEGDSIILQASGALNYQWSGGIGNGVSFIPTSSQTYTVTGTDAYGCSKTNSINVTVNNLPNVLAFTVDSIICSGSNTTLTANGAQMYSWIPSMGLSSSSMANPIASPTDTTTYIVTGTDVNGCSNTASVVINVKPLPTVSPIGNQTYCNGQSVAAIALSGSPANVSFTILGGASRGLPNQFNVNEIPAFVAAPPGVASIQIIPNANGCIGPTYNYTMTVSNCPPVSVNVKFYIAGYYLGAGLMQKVLFNEGEIADSTSNNCDYVIVELHHTTAPYAVSKSTIATLKTNGTLVCNFTGSVTNTPYYIVINHRNGIYTWSANPVVITQGVAYDFSTAANKAYGNNQQEVSPGVWAFYNGDINQDENMDLLDVSILESDAANFIYGYYATDLNGDGNVDLLDIPILDWNVFNFIYSQHP